MSTGRRDGARVPVIFSRTPYQFNPWVNGEESTRTYERAYEAVKRGYAYVVQNERGRYFSEGGSGTFSACPSPTATMPSSG